MPCSAGAPKTGERMTAIAPNLNGDSWSDACCHGSDGVSRRHSKYCMIRRRLLKSPHGYCPQIGGKGYVESGFCDVIRENACF